MLYVHMTDNINKTIKEREPPPPPKNTVRSIYRLDSSSDGYLLGCESLNGEIGYIAVANLNAEFAPEEKRQ